MRLETLTGVVKVIGVLVLLHMLANAFVFYQSRIGYNVTIPLALSIQVTVASLLFVGVSIFLAFFGASRLDDIREKALNVARESARSGVKALAREEAAKIPSSSMAARPPMDKATIEGEDESVI